jgi:hypothetical protein
VPALLFIIAYLIYSADPVKAYAELENLCPAPVRSQLSLLLKFGGLLPLLAYSWFYSMLWGGLLLVALGLLYYDSTLPPSPTPAPPKKTPKKQAGAGLGIVTQLTHNLANTADYIAELVSWVIPEQTAGIFLALCGACVGSLLVPLWPLLFIGGIYTFTINAVYMRYPVVAKRYPIGRVIAIAKGKIFGINKPAGKLEANITLTIIEARKLRSSDPFDGKPDAFVKASVGSVHKKTKVIDDSFDPKWNETLDLGKQVADQDGTIDITLEIFDQDDIGTYDFLGTAQITLTSVIASQEKWLTLNPSDYDSGAYVTGQLKVKIEMTDASANKKTK